MFKKEECTGLAGTFNLGCEEKKQKMTGRSLGGGAISREEKK